MKRLMIVLVFLFSVSFVFAVSDPNIFGHLHNEINWTASSCTGGLVMGGITTSGTASCVTYTGNSLAAEDKDPIQAVFVDAVGYVGIGTTSPWEKLDVIGRIASRGASNGIYFQKSTGFRFWIDDDETTNSLVFSTGTNPGGEVKMVIKASGNVGIGTTSPNSKLVAEATGTRIAVFASTAASYGRIMVVVPSTRDSQISFAEGTHDSFTTGWTIGMDGTDDSLHFHKGAGAFDGTSEFTILSNGNVGIGTISPDGRLHIKSTSGQIILEDADEGDSLRLERDSGGFNIDLFSSGKVLFRVQDNGNVGIGTDSPGVKLEIKGNEPTTSTAWEGIFRFKDASNVVFGSFYRDYNGASEYLGIEAPSGKPIVFQEFGGNVGIGTTDPKSRLHVESGGQGALIISQSSNLVNKRLFRLDPGKDTIGGDRLNIQALDDGGNWVRDLIQLYHDGDVVLNPYAGNVGIGTTNPGSYKLYVAGEAYCSGSASCWNEGSSRELKENIVQLDGQDMQDILDKVIEMPVYYFTYKNDSTQEVQLGIIAEDSPDLITGHNKTTVGGVSIANFALTAIKAQQLQIDELKAIICLNYPTAEVCQ